MAIIKEFRCLWHGVFEGSHAICPCYGCESDSVERVFLTPVSVGSQSTRRTDAGLRRSAEMMRIRDWRSSRHEGDVSFKGRAAEENDSPIGTQVLWGDQIQKKMGMDIGGMSAAASAPLSVPGKTASDPYLTVNNGLRATANTTGVLQSRLPAAEITGHMGDRK